ncbi:MAG TPA: hypothetical protein IAB56_03095 [Candidatus Scybalousia intestinigallinarum]|nr:hypothetical protein [Candidatus Scybalousia intestinigallinarum]
MSKIDDDALKLINEDRKKYSYESMYSSKKNENSPFIYIFFLLLLGLGVYTLVQTVLGDHESPSEELSDEEILSATTEYLKDKTIYVEAICDHVEQQACTEDNCSLGKYQVTCHTQDIEFNITVELINQSSNHNSEFNFTVLTDTIHSYSNK